ncbi:MAG TPA: helix-turn-helix domain-containing protein [bacterium]|nr:helix-turn-helix domain-containing protein [bacterium]
MTARAPAPREKGFLTPQEVAAQLRVSPGVVLRLLRRGDLPAVRVGRAWRVDEDEFRRWTRRRHARGSAGRAALNGRGAVCLCGCGERVVRADARFLPGHDGKMVHRLMTEEGMTFDAAREAVRRVHRPRQQQRLF